VRHLDGAYLLPDNPSGVTLLQGIEMQGSDAGKLSSYDVQRVLLHAVQMAAGTGLTVLAENLGNLNLGLWQPIASIAVAAGIDLLRRWVSDTKAMPVEPAK
jgi:hypothetical protein